MNKVKQLAKNQFEIYASEGTYFQSYNSIIVFIPREGKTQLDEKYWNYSNVTGKFRNQFLGENINDTRLKIQKGEYELTDLNK
jgi:hypothetical protein